MGLHSHFNFPQYNMSCASKEGFFIMQILDKEENQVRAWNEEHNKKGRQCGR